MAMATKVNPVPTERDAHIGCCIDGAGSKGTKISGIVEWTETFSILVIFVYFTGFIYRYYYLRGLGIDVHESDDQIYTIFVYALDIYLQHFAWTTIIFGLILLLTQVRALGYWWGIAARIILLFGFPLLWRVSLDCADVNVAHARLNDTGALPLVSIQLQAGSLKMLPADFKSSIFQQGQAITWRRIMTTKDAVYVLDERPAVTLPISGEQQFRRGKVYRIPVSKIELMTTILPCNDVPRFKDGS
jgi:hypothetical protein